MNPLFLALAPIFIILIYIYIRDKYEKEPWELLLKTLLAGAFITLPIVLMETFLSGLFGDLTELKLAAYNAFVVAGFTEELFKFLVIYLFIRKNRNFNEPFDGIVYSVFVSLGFAAVENILYVSNYGIDTGFMRAVTAVPAHAIFGVIMGFYFGKSLHSKRPKYLYLALFMPILFHGIYDFILMSQHYLFLLLIIPFLIYLWKNAFKKISYLSNKSVFKP